MLIIWLKFLLVSVVIAVAGYKLSRYADAIAEKTGAGRSWIGVVLLATVTALPELTISVTSIRFANQPDLAIGDLLGSCVANLALLGIFDFVCKRKSIFSEAGSGHILSASLNLVLFAPLLMEFFFSQTRTIAFFSIVGISAPLLIGLYLLSMRLIYRFEHEKEVDITGDSAGGPEVSRMPLKGIIVRLSVAAFCILAAGSYLPFVAKDIVQVMGWSGAFMGTLFLAVVTSLPEAAVTYSALRIGQAGLVYGNILGSNLLNLALIGVSDLLYVKGPIITAVSKEHALSAAMAIFMIGIVMSEASLTRTVERGRWNKVTSLVLVLAFLLNNWLSYRMGSGS